MIIELLYVAPNVKKYAKVPLKRQGTKQKTRFNSSKLLKNLKSS